MVVDANAGVVYVKVPCESKFPPLAASYQSKVNPAATVPVKVAEVEPQMVTFGTTAVEGLLKAKVPLLLKV